MMHCAESRISMYLHEDTPHQEGDRKSTRLNSSHSQISYAVFCLKKKKNTKNSRTYSNHPKTSTGTRLLRAYYTHLHSHSILTTTTTITYYLLSTIGQACYTPQR